jgi:hypothetical protein
MHRGVAGMQASVLAVLASFFGVCAVSFTTPCMRPLEIDSGAHMKPSVSGRARCF